MTVAGVFPAVARDLESAPDPAGREHDRLGPENLEPPALAIVTESADDAPVLFQERENGVLHVDVDPLVNAVILQSADHFQAGAIAHMREARIFVAAKIALQNPPVLGAIEDRAPGLEFAHPRRRFPGVQLGHAPIVDVLPAPHGIGEMDLPIVAIVDVGERGRDPALGHDGVGFA